MLSLALSRGLASPAAFVARGGVVRSTFPAGFTEIALARPAASSFGGLGGDFPPQHPSPQQQQVRFATKKAAGSTSNSSDSAGRRLGIKVWPGQYAKAGSIIVRQRGKKFLKGTNTGMGNDHTVFATAAGIVRMERSPKNRKRNIIHVEPEE